MSRVAKPRWLRELVQLLTMKTTQKDKRNAVEKLLSGALDATLDWIENNPLCAVVAINALWMVPVIINAASR